MLQSGDLDIFSSKRKKKERKKKEERRKGLLRDIYVWYFLLAYIAGILEGKEKGKRNCFSNLIIICLVVAY